MVPSGEEASFLCHLWHSAHSVPEKASCGTEYARGAQNRLLWYAAHFQGHSVRRTGFSGTGVTLNCCKGSTNREKYKK